MNQDEDTYSVPDDFPNGESGAVSGAQPKFTATKWNDKYYVGLTPPDRHARWKVLEDIAQQFIANLSGPRPAKYIGMAEVAILDQYLTRLYRAEFGSEQEMRWIIRRVA